MAKIIHVHLLEGSVNGQKDFYFGSISAVLTVLTPRQLGISPSYIHHIGLSGNGTYTNTKCIIKQSEIITCRRR